jgi:molybdenum cofactor guanylyltransferase
MTAINNNLYGLILAGGRSKRMGFDKSLLVYHHKPQIEHAYDLLRGYCEKVFVSTRADLGSMPGYAHLPQIHDLPQFSDIGPTGGILSAMSLYKDVSWLILASDLPYVTSETLDFLIQNRKPEYFATAFISGTDRLPEPLCAVWEGKAKELILSFLKDGLECPRKMLIKSDTHLIEQKNPKWLDNINYPKEYEAVRKNPKI